MWTRRTYYLTCTACYKVLQCVTRWEELKKEARWWSQGSLNKSSHGLYRIWPYHRKAAKVILTVKSQIRAVIFKLLIYWSLPIFSLSCEEQHLPYLCNPGLFQSVPFSRPKKNIWNTADLEPLASFLAVGLWAEEPVFGIVLCSEPGLRGRLGLSFLLDQEVNKKWLMKKKWLGPKVLKRIWFHWDCVAPETPSRTIWIPW